MSRSKWACVESCGPVSVVACGAGEWARFEDRGRLGRVPLAGAVLSTKRLVGLIAASMFVMAAAPASALAGSTSGSHPKRSTNHAKHRSVSVAHAGALVLALGSGYSSRRDAVRVRALQRRLTRAGYALGPIDGRYGQRTERAVRRFQIAHGLVVDGIAGPRTLASLSRSSVVLYPGAGYAGRSSGAVRALQRRLTRAGYAPGLIDGRYGPRTEQAVRRFQAAHGLLVDGIAGPQTVGRLIERTRKAARPSRPTKPHQRANRPTRHARSHPQPHTAPRRRAPAPRKAVSPTHSTSSPSLALVVLFVALVAGGLWATWLAYRRRRKQYAVVETQTGAQRPDPAAAIPTDPSHTATPHQPPIPNGDLTGLDPAERAFNDAVVLEEQGDLAAATASYRRADQLGHGPAACNLGVLLLVEQGDRAGAGECFRRADQRGLPAGAFNLAVVLEEEGDQIEALRAYERAAQLGDPETAELARSAVHDLRRRIERSSAARKGGGPDDS
jgi:hypothetical protein